MRLSLDQLESERGEVEPFELDLGDRVIVLPHPEDMPYETMINLEDAGPSEYLRALMGDDDFDAFVTAEDSEGKKRVTLGILEAIMEKYGKHYGLGSPGNGVGSRRSVTGSARRSRRT